jgi:hypothetical protein
LNRADRLRFSLRRTAHEVARHKNLAREKSKIRNTMQPLSLLPIPRTKIFASVFQNYVVP